VIARGAQRHIHRTFRLHDQRAIIIITFQHASSLPCPLPNNLNTAIRVPPHSPREHRVPQHKLDAVSDHRAGIGGANRQLPGSIAQHGRTDISPHAAIRPLVHERGGGGPEQGAAVAVSGPVVRHGCRQGGRGHVACVRVCMYACVHVCMCACVGCVHVCMYANVRNVYPCICLRMSANFLACMAAGT